MRFTTAWANVLSQNVTLRITLLLISVCATVFAICAARLATRAPLIIERECFSSVRAQSSTKHTQSEIEAFILVSLPKRFDTVASDTSLFLSDEENAFRVREQSELQKKGITQRVLPLRESIKINGQSIKVDADRILSIGKIKSVLAFSLVVEIASTDRSDGNPYGLVLKSVREPSQQKQAEGGK